MGQEIDLLINYPRSKRNVEERGENKTEDDRRIARTFGKAFFDGSRNHGYGGFNYHPRFWQPVIPMFERHYGLSCKSTLLDVGCAKGFMLYDYTRLVPGIKIAGVDISSYAIEHCMEDIKEFVEVANAINLPFPDDSFDIVISINTIHNLDIKGCEKALLEIERVSRGNSFITVDAYQTEAEKERMMAWNLTAKTIMHVDDWKSFFNDVGYTGDYYWFTP